MSHTANNGARATDQAAAPLVQALMDYVALHRARFHMPGHKGKAPEAEAATCGARSDARPVAGTAVRGAGATDPELASLFLTGAGPLRADVTEVEGLDDLHAPGGPINEAQRLAALAYGADRTFFLVNGSTCGLEAVIMAACGPGDEIIVSRDTHMAVASGLVLSGARPVYVAPEVDELYGIPLGPSADRLDAALRRHPRARAVVLTNPNYYGVAPDVKTLVAIAHGYGKIAVVDEAHGAHLPFHEALPPSALAAGADAVVSGAHKSLPAMTQAAFLHLKGGALDAAKVGRMLRLVETSSPSYVLMASLDAARRVAATRGRELLDGVIRWAAAARERLSRLPGVMCLDADRLAARGFAHDPTKLVVSFWGLRSRGITGVEIARRLLERHGVEVELADARNILAILTMADSEADVERLVVAIESEIAGICSDGDAGERRGEVDRRARRRCRAAADDEAGEVRVPVTAYGPCHEVSACSLFSSTPPLRMTPREAALSPTEWMPVREACGRVAADVIVPYPPGLPVVCPGEEITEPLVEFVLNALSSGTAPRLRGVRGDGAVLVVAGAGRARPGRGPGA